MGSKRFGAFIIHIVTDVLAVIKQDIRIFCGN